jgi:hypothetical protein
LIHAFSFDPIPRPSTDYNGDVESTLSTICPARRRRVSSTKSRAGDGSTTSGVVHRSVRTGRSSRRMKLLQFHENYRPPWWGVRRVVSTIVNGRQDPSLIHDDKTRTRYLDTNMNYDIESDDDWDDEPEDGENIDDNKDSDNDDDDDDDEIKRKDGLEDMVITLLCFNDAGGDGVMTMGDRDAL